MEEADLASRIRAFNRLYTEAIGSLSEQHEGLNVTLAQSRVLYTVKSIDQPQVGQIADALGLDLAYTSRLLGSLEDQRLIRRTISSVDRRQRVVDLTREGERLVNEIERRSDQRVLGLVQHLDPNDLQRLLDAMQTIDQLITNKEHRHGQSD